MLGREGAALESGASDFGHGQRASSERILRCSRISITSSSTSTTGRRLITSTSRCWAWPESSPEAAGNPLDACSYRIGSQQINVHGPWPGNDGRCCPPPLNEIGRADLAFATTLAPDAVIARLELHGVPVVAGPISRFGARGNGTSVYCHDPSGNEIEIISYTVA